MNERYLSPSFASMRQPVASLSSVIRCRILKRPIWSLHLDVTLAYALKEEDFFP